MLRTEEMLLNVGPQHPSTHGVFRIVLKIDGEIIKEAKPVIGYLHRGTEKLAENLQLYANYSLHRPDGLPFSDDE